MDTCIERLVRADPRKVFELAAAVGEYFVNGVARRTLRRIGRLAERPS
jgi:hypothetical protein